MNEDMKYVRFILLTSMWVSLLLSFIFGAFLFISGIKMVYSELELINSPLTNGLLCIVMGGLVLRFVILIIQGVILEND